jgi:hypothetical protein
VPKGDIPAIARSPDGAVSGSPGYNAANVIARDLGIQKWWQPVPSPSWPRKSVAIAAE